MLVGAWIILVQAFAGAKKTKAPNFNLLKSEAVSNQTTRFCLLYKGVSREMTKLALLGLITVCITVLCFALLKHERLCSFNISSGDTVVQAILSCDK